MTLITDEEYIAEWSKRPQGELEMLFKEKTTKELNIMFKYHYEITEAYKEKYGHKRHKEARKSNNIALSITFELMRRRRMGE